LLIMIVLETSIAQDSNNSKIQNTTLFTLDKERYTEKNFPFEYQKLSKKDKKEFISRFLYYKIFLKSLKKEEKKYASQIQKAFQEKEKEFKRKGIVLNELKKILFDKKLIGDTIAYNEVLAKHKNIDREIKKFYIKHKDGYKFPKRIEVAHIVLKDINKSKELIKKIENNNNDIKLFAKFAEKYSMDKKTKNNGGYVGEIEEKGMGKKFFDAVWNTKEGSIVSKSLKHNNYYHIIYVFKKYEVTQRTLKDERENIEKMLLKKEIRKWKFQQYSKNKKNTIIKFYKIKL